MSIVYIVSNEYDMATVSVHFTSNVYIVSIVPIVYIVYKYRFHNNYQTAFGSCVYYTQ